MTETAETAAALARVTQGLDTYLHAQGLDTQGLTGAGPDAPRLAVAVSGGGDSMALLHMLAARVRDLQAVTVDHGLRAESAAEAAMVAGVCATLRVPHTTLRWQGWDGQGNTQNAARMARLALIGDWAREQGITDIALAHTLEDQAETVFQRLLRGSGVDGLSGMAATRRADGLCWHRPLLGARRADLRDYLRRHGLAWVEDPSNEDEAYSRVRLRRMMREMGIDAQGLADTAARMARARRALEPATVALARDCVRLGAAGDLRLSRPAFEAAPQELRYRLVAGILRWMSGAPYRPRFDSLAALLAAGADRGRTLHGCVLRRTAGEILIRREPARVAPPVPVGQHWDHRWQVTPGPQAVAATHIGALGAAGLAETGAWRETGHPREVLLATPALYNGKTLVAAPLAGWPGGWHCDIVDGEKGLHNALMTR